LVEGVKQEGCVFHRRSAAVGPIYLKMSTRRHLKWVQRYHSKSCVCLARCRVPEALQQGLTLILSETTPKTHRLMAQRRPVSILRYARVSACVLLVCVFFTHAEHLRTTTQPLPCVTDTTAAVPVHANSRHTRRPRHCSCSFIARNSTWHDLSVTKYKDSCVALPPPAVAVHPLRERFSCPDDFANVPFVAGHVLLFRA